MPSVASLSREKSAHHLLVNLHPGVEPEWSWDCHRHRLAKKKMQKDQCLVRVLNVFLLRIKSNGVWVIGKLC